MKKIITVIPCRTRSTRLPQKAVLPIFGISAIQRCLMQTLAISDSKASVLATTTNSEDDILCEHTLNGKADLVRGSEEDVLERFLKAVEKHGADIVIRATGDCPVVSYEMVGLLVKSHLASGADISYPRSGFPVGTNCEVYDARALKRLRELMPRTLHSEYLVLYFINNPEIFKVNEVTLPEIFHRQWRLTLDEQSDLDLFERMFSSLRVGERPIAFQEIVNFFSDHPETALINRQNKLKYVHDKPFIEYLKKVTTLNP